MSFNPQRGFGLISLSVLIFLTSVFSGQAFGQVAQKQIYIPTFITNAGMDLNDSSSQWSYRRSVETENWIIFWEPGFGADPAQAQGDYYVNMEQLKQTAEESFKVMLEELKMVEKGKSKTDQYKQMIFLLYSTDWSAYGSGQDDKVGTLHVNPAAANIPTVVAHEIGHCFEYMTGADVPGGGLRYGFGPNASGGNGFWEQVAQWQSFKVYPNEQFKVWDFGEYVKNNHLHIIHETPRYANYFLPDYWAYKRGIDFMGKLWRGAKQPEDPIEAYQRLNAISQSEFNDEMYEHAARLTTWDLPLIKSYGQSYLAARPQVKFNADQNSFYRIDSAETLENYGYNSIQLEIPTMQRRILVEWEGLAGAQGYRNKNYEQAGWRAGFVALLQDDSRIYGPMQAFEYKGGNPLDSMFFEVPQSAKSLWLVVSGAPQNHWRHPWDDDNSNDEQWPYRLRFTNTQFKGSAIDRVQTFYHITADTSLYGQVRISDEWLAEGKTVRIEAIPQEGYSFNQWLGDLAGQANPIQWEMYSDLKVSAEFISQTVALNTSEPRGREPDGSLNGIEQFLNQSGNQIEIYNSEGRLMSTVRSPRAMNEVSSYLANSPGNYLFVWVENGFKTKSHQVFIKP